MAKMAYGTYNGHPCRVVSIRPCSQEALKKDLKFEKIISIEFLDNKSHCGMDLLDKIFYDNFEPQNPFDVLEMQEEFDLLFKDIDPNAETSQLPRSA